jgi:hypothetical protein
MRGRKLRFWVVNNELFVKRHNAGSKSFFWAATTDSILQNIKRLCQYISGISGINLAAIRQTEILSIEAGTA